METSYGWFSFAPLVLGRERHVSTHPGFPSSPDDRYCCQTGPYAYYGSKCAHNWGGKACKGHAVTWISFPSILQTCRLRQISMDGYIWRNFSKCCQSSRFQLGRIWTVCITCCKAQTINFNNGLNPSACDPQKSEKTWGVDSFRGSLTGLQKLFRLHFVLSGAFSPKCKHMLSLRKLNSHEETISVIGWRWKSRMCGNMPFTTQDQRRERKSSLRCPNTLWFEKKLYLGP